MKSLLIFVPNVLLLHWFEAKMIEKTHKYQDKWEDLDKRPLPEWYDRAKVGIFVHWGVYSVPAFGTEWFWKHWRNGNIQYVTYMNKNFPKSFEYEKFALSFTAEFFEPVKWANLFAKSGAKYVVLTSKHHDGFTLFPSKKLKKWNSVDTGPHRDIVKELAKAVRAKGLKFGVYYSLIEWFHPLYLGDVKTQLRTQKYVDQKLMPELKQVVQDYKPSMVWSDGVWHAKDGYFKSKAFLAWLYNESPVKDEVVVNDRWGNNTHCLHGGVYNCKDRYNPGVLQLHKWENAFTIDKQSWGYRQNIELNEVLSIQEIIKQLITTISCGGLSPGLPTIVSTFPSELSARAQRYLLRSGRLDDPHLSSKTKAFGKVETIVGNPGDNPRNVLINVGPTKQGTIIPIFQERLLALGQWLGINGLAIYSSSPWKHQNDSLNPGIWYTCCKQPYDDQNPIKAPVESDLVTAVFAIFQKWPLSNVLKIKDMVTYMNKYNQIEMLGERLFSYLKWKIKHGALLIYLPNKATVKSEYAWTLKFTMNADYVTFHEHTARNKQ